MKRFAVGILLFLAVAVSPMFAQEFTTDQILAKLDEKAKVFKSVQSAIEKQHVNVGRAQAVESGTLSMVLSKGVPKVMLEFTAPVAVRRLLDDGKATMYNVAENTFQEFKYDPKSEKLAYLMMGFGTPAATLRKGYTPAVKPREMIKGVNTVVLELTALEQLGDFTAVRLWLDPATWTPVQVRLLQTEKSYEEFRYSKVQLNKDVPGSAFDLKKKPGAKKQ